MIKNEIGFVLAVSHFEHIFCHEGRYCITIYYVYQLWYEQKHLWYLKPIYEAFYINRLIFAFYAIAFWYVKLGQSNIERVTFFKEW